MTSRRSRRVRGQARRWAPARRPRCLHQVALRHPLLPAVGPGRGEQRAWRPGRPRLRSPVAPLCALLDGSRGSLSSYLHRANERHTAHGGTERRRVPPAEGRGPDHSRRPQSGRQLPWPVRRPRSSGGSHPRHTKTAVYGRETRGVSPILGDTYEPPLRPSFPPAEPLERAASPATPSPRPPSPSPPAPPTPRSRPGNGRGLLRSPAWLRRPRP